MFDAGKLRSVGSLDTAGRALQVADVGRVVGIDVPVLTVRWVNWGRVDLVASLYSESLRGLDAAFLGHRGR